MERVAYSKPNMKFVDLRNNQAVAADKPCLGAAAGTDGGVFYYDITGNGWIVVLTPANCNGTITDMYYEAKDLNAPQPSQDVVNQAMADARAAMDADKQVFAGALAWNPDPEWS